MRPKRDLAVCVTELQVIHNQARLWRIIDIEGRLGPRNHDLHLRPHARFEIDIGLVLSRVLRTKPIPAKIRTRGIWDGVIAAQLIIGADVEWPRVDVLESRTAIL